VDIYFLQANERHRQDSSGFLQHMWEWIRFFLPQAGVDNPGQSGDVLLDTRG